MNPTTKVTREAQSLIEAVCDGMATDAQVRNLESLLLTDEETRKFYVDLLDLDAELQWLVGSLQEGDAALDEFLAAKQTPPPQPAPTFPATLFNSTLGYLSSGWPVAYLIATVIFGIGMLIGSHVYVSQPAQVARQSVPLLSPLSPLPTMVGRITGMVDCQWEKGSGVRGQGSEPVVSGQWSVASGQKQSESRFSSHQPLVTSHFVSLGDKFILASGLMEITYDTGAKVILQGPVTYEVESATGGYLSIGKLTAKLEKNAASGQWSVANKSPNLQISKSPNSSLSTIHSPLFTVRTPTATVTDLGTEFGVEVGKDSSDVCVFAGGVEVSTRSGNGKVANRILLTANGQRSARTRVGHTAATLIAVNPEAFVRIEKFKAIVGHRPQHVWIGNASFDDPKLEAGALVFQYGAPAIWTVERFGDANFGVHRLSSDGPQFFFWDEPYGSLRQRYLAHRVEAAGMAYTLRFRVGTRNVGKCSVTAHLLLNGEPPKERSLTLELQKHRPVEVNVAEFVDAKFVYVTTPSDVGKRVGIQFDFATIERLVQVLIGDVQLIVAPGADMPGTTARPTKEGEG